MTEIISTRQSGTGAWWYDFFDRNGIRIGSVRTTVAYAAPVIIESAAHTWFSRFAVDTAIISRCRRANGKGRQTIEK